MTSITTDSTIVPDIEAAAAAAVSAAAIMTTETSGLMTKPTGKSSPRLMNSLRIHAPISRQFHHRMSEKNIFRVNEQ